MPSLPSRNLLLAIAIKNMQKQIRNFSFPVQFYCISPFCSKYFVQDFKLKEITCLMTIARTKNIFSALKFFQKHYWDSGSGKLIAEVQASNLKRLELWKLLHCYMLYEKTIVARRKQPVRGVSRKQLILSCKNIKTDN